MSRQQHKQPVLLAEKKRSFSGSLFRGKRRTSFFYLCISVFLMVLATIYFPSRAVAQEATPGSSCSVTGSLINSGGPEISGSSHIMICNGTNWISVMEYKDTGEVLFQNAYDSGACTTAKDGRLL